MNIKVRYAPVFFVFLCMVVANGQNPTDVPNILWIVSEDNSPLIGAYGDPYATTPHIDKLASEGILYENAFSSAPVCAPSRSTLITGVYPVSMGTQHMRSTYPIPESILFYPRYLRDAGYYTTNNAKKDYNTIDQPEAWDESGKNATYRNRKEGQPFFAIFNTGISHESSIHDSIPEGQLRHNPKTVPIPPYHPRTPAMEHDWAQYYDKIEDMDQWVGKILDELERSGEAENTIVFYYSDHGGVLGRSKRFLFDSGLHVPLIVRFPEKYQHLAPGPAGSRIDRLVSFIDFPPTILRLAGIAIPDYMQGVSFLDAQNNDEPEYAFGFRGRMDERIDMSRTARDQQYRYTRNFLPHKIYGQYLEYLWRAPSMQSWSNAYEAGILSPIQSRFFEAKEVEELYDIEADPDNIHNLAKDPKYRQVLERMRNATLEWMISIRDVGLIPESMMERLAENTTIYEYVRSTNYPVEEILSQVNEMTFGDIPAIQSGLSNQSSVIRYWAATAAGMYFPKTKNLENELLEMSRDPSVAVRIAVAESLYRFGQTSLAQHLLIGALKDEYEKTRLQALNALDLFTERDLLPLWPAIRKIVPADNKNRNYDVRAARGLMAKFDMK